ncbi:hypothetical protein N431DRAFT_433139 [Stipitochalara longipes BDJ]|nr:hypothetical protein N431DRAFT_433139 [Stipitochalara longipes BDJ]
MSPKPLLSAAPKSTNFPYKELVPIPRQRLSLVFADDQEARCFLLFQESTSRTLAGCGRSNLWHRVILQACETEPSIRHAVIALGALDLNKSTGQKSHHEFALRQYSKAIKHMERSLSLGTRDIRSALILCLLTICFETWNGDAQSALAQVRLGLRLIQEWQKERSWPELLADKELYLAFVRLDNDTIMFINEEPIPIERCQKLSTNFTSLQDAYFTFEVLVREFSHWIAETYAWGSQSKEVATRVSATTTPPQYSVAEQRQNYLSAFRRWHKAFQILLKERPETHPEHTPALLIELRFKSLYTCLAPDHFQGETVYDAHIAEFDEAIDLADRVFALAIKTIDVPLYSFDGSFVVSVYVIAMKCRDGTVRRNAIRILRSRQIRQGTMDSELRARLIELQMEIEEAGAVGMYIPEEARIRGIKTTCNMAKKRGTMTYLEMVEAGKNKFEAHSLDFTW